MTTKRRERKKMISLHLDPRTVVALQALSARTRVPQATYMREGIDLVLARYGKGAKS
jgi:predicted DNA-binding protein